MSRSTIIVKLFGRLKFYVQLRPLAGRLLIVRRFNFNTPFPPVGGGRALREAVKIHNAPQKAALFRHRIAQTLMSREKAALMEEQLRSQDQRCTVLASVPQLSMALELSSIYKFILVHFRFKCFGINAKHCYYFCSGSLVTRYPRRGAATTFPNFIPDQRHAGAASDTIMLMGS